MKTAYETLNFNSSFLVSQSVLVCICPLNIRV